MKIIFCLSYLNIPDALTLIDLAKEDYLLITHNRNLHLLFSKIYGPSKLLLFERSTLRSSFNPLVIVKGLWALQAEKMRAWRIISRYQGAEVYFFSTAFYELEAWLIYKLSKKNKIFYRPAVSMEHLKERRSFMSIIYRVFCRFFYRFDVMPKTDGERAIYILDQRFLRRIGAVKNDLPVNQTVIRAFYAKNFPIERKKVLLLTGGIVEERYVDQQEYVNKTDALIEMLLEAVGPEEIAIKVHPRFSRVHSRETGLYRLPDYLPANLICEHYDIVIGYNTATIFEAGNQGKTAISLLEYYEPLNRQVKIKSMEYLKNNAKTMIHFPALISDLRSILKA